MGWTNNTRLLDPVKCAIDGIVWDRRVDALPSCQHTLQEWEDKFTANQAQGMAEIDIRTRWLTFPEDQWPVLPAATGVVLEEEKK
jgi:hypothetical protein